MENNITEEFLDIIIREIMNLKCNPPYPDILTDVQDRAYKVGHRDARHSAIEVILKIKAEARDAD